MPDVHFRLHCKITQCEPKNIAENENHDISKTCEHYTEFGSLICLANSCAKSVVLSAVFARQKCRLHGRVLMLKIVQYKNALKLTICVFQGRSKNIDRRC